MIGSLFFADKFVLIGDHYQLSPIIQSKAAGDLGTPKIFFLYQ
jgi:superfamily I DNA and/or RNA helicase